MAWRLPGRGLLRRWLEPVFTRSWKQWARPCHQGGVWPGAESVARPLWMAVTAGAGRLARQTPGLAGGAPGWEAQKQKGRNWVRQAA